MPVAAVAIAAVATVAAVDNEDGIQWWWAMKMAFNGSGSVQRQRWWGLRISNAKVMMEIDISGGGWQRRASAFDSSDGQRWALAFDGGDGLQLWQRWTIETAFNGGSGGGV